MTDTQAIHVSTAQRGVMRDLALAGVASTAAGFGFWGMQHATIGDAWMWQGGTAAALVATAWATARATTRQKHMRDAVRDLRRAAEPEIVKGLLLLTGPKPAKPAKAEKVAKPASDETPKVSAIERERERLRAGGFSDAEISQILIARESQGSHGGGLGQGALTGVLNNLTTVMAHARNFLPSLKADLANVLDAEASASERIGGAVNLALKACVIGVLVYIVQLEFVQLRAMVEKTKAEACSARAKNLLDSVPMSQLGPAAALLAKDCSPVPMP